MPPPDGSTFSSGTSQTCGEDRCPFATRIEWLENTQRALANKVNAVLEFVKQIAERDKKLLEDAHACRISSEASRVASETAVEFAKEAANHASQLNERFRDRDTPVDLPRPRRGQPDVPEPFQFDDDWENISTEILERLPPTTIATQIRKMDSDLRGLRIVQEAALKEREEAESARRNEREEKERIADEKAAAEMKARQRLIFSIVFAVLAAAGAVKAVVEMFQ